jgi:hypothetical protein
MINEINLIMFMSTLVFNQIKFAFLFGVIN